jgi:4-amino-4-deoxy-L-arabinose transferase-like glycosyltransferase
MRDLAASSQALPIAIGPRRSDVFVVALLACGTALIYGARLSEQPLVGEETRWATAAREMLVTGDWIVPRQQGQVFPERPPMTIWLMAIAGWFRGDVDPIAIRLPSVVAVVLTTLLIYAYSRLLISQTTAIVAALAYVTFGQVLQIGRLGESEAVFALLVSASLLLWHLGYLRGWRPVVVWSSAFACAALAALVKGPQAPVYFGAIIGVYLLFVRRDWRYLLGWQPVFGAMVFFAIVGAWQVPFYWDAGWPAIVATWTGLAGDRFYLGGALSHAITYPLETFACLLPWSPILVTLVHRNTRELVAGERRVTAFLLTAIAVAYPTVWLAAGARGRYFMPLYPLVAILVGVVVVRCSSAALGSYPRRAWRQFLAVWGLVIAAGGLIVGGCAVLPGDTAGALYQPRWFGLLFGLTACIAVYVLWRAAFRPMGNAATDAVVALATVAALGAAGLMVNVNAARWYDPTAFIAELKRQLPAGANLVSLSPIEHRFAYYYGAPIAELGWPRSMHDLPPNVDYFCFMRYPSDTADSRAAGRGRSWYTTPGTLPFAWDELEAASVDRRINTKTAMIVVLGRVVRPLQAKVSDATQSQRSTVQRPSQSSHR